MRATFSIGLMVLLTLTLGESGFAKDKTKSSAKVKKVFIDPDFNEGILEPTATHAQFTQEFDDAVNAAWKEQARKPAGDKKYEEKDLEPDFVSFRDALINAKNADELETLLLAANKNYNNYSSSTKFFVAQLVPLLKLRSIVWRLRPVFEHGNVFNGTKSSHAMAVSIIRTVANIQNIYLPVDTWNALFEFVTVPSAKMSNMFQWTEMSQFQNHVASQIIPAMKLASNRIGVIMTTKGTIKTAIWDNRIFYGKDSFRGDVRRFVGFGLPEMSAVQAGLFYSIHSAQGFCAYNQNKLIKVLEALGHMIGIDGFNPGETLGITSQDRRNKLYAFRGDGFLQLVDHVGLRGEFTGRELMKSSFANLNSAVQAANAAWSKMQNVTDDAHNLAINPIYGRDSVNPNIRKSLKAMKELLKGEKTLDSPITGESTTINLVQFYNNPPDNLLDLLPSKFEPTSPEQYYITGKSGDKMVYRNYMAGRAIGWKGEYWKQLLPGAEAQNSDYIAMSMRVLKTSHGARFLTLPMMAFVQ